MSRGHRPVALGGWLVVVAALTWGLQQAGTGSLAPPPLTAPEGWGPWLEGRDPVTAAMAVLRLVALGVAWYLLVASLLGATLRLLRARRLVSIADRVTLPALRRLLVATAGMTLASGLLPGAVLARSANPPAVVAGAPHLLATAAVPAPTSTTVPAGPPTVTMRLLPAEPVAAPVVSSPPPPARARAPTSTWTVRPGECFWSIAEDVLVQAWGRPVTDAEIVPYWQVLLEANRGRLAYAGNADLIFAGQEFVVPAPPARAA